ncbi:MAG: TonB family protein [Pyrinomonadaceae bacterium]
MHGYTLKILTASFFIFSIVVVGLAQDGPKTVTLAELKNNPPQNAPTSAEVMRMRVAQAKAFLVVKNYTAAIYELENIRRETSDPTVNRVLNVLLMHAYLEQGDYQKAQKFLKDLKKDPGKTEDYFAVAGQVVNGAKAQYARYQSLGISPTDGTLPDEAKKDLDQMRDTLEIVIGDAKDIGKSKTFSETAVAILEESSSARGQLARDSFDERRWRDQVSEAREQIVASRSKIINAVVPEQTDSGVTLVAKNMDDNDGELVEPDEDSTQANPEVAKSTENPVETVTTETVNFRPVPEKKPEEANSKLVSENTPVADKNSSAKTTKGEAKPAVEPSVKPSDRKIVVIPSAKEEDRVASENKSEQPNVKSTDQTTKPGDPFADSKQNSSEGGDNPFMAVGSLIDFATKQVRPVYPAQARSLRMTGTVRVEVLVDEDGRVSKVENSSGPALLKRAAQDAVLKWQFRPFVRDGQPVKATGYVNFNFSL